MPTTHKRKRLKTGTPRQIAQRDVDRLFSESAKVTIGESKYKQKQAVYDKYRKSGVPDGTTLNHLLGQSLHINGYGTLKQYKNIIAMFYSFCIERYGVHSLSQLSPKFVTRYLDYQRLERGTTRGYICKTIVSALQKLNVLLREKYHTNYDYDGAVRRYIKAHYDDIENVGKIQGTYRGYGVSESARIVAWAKEHCDEKVGIVFHLMLKYCCRVGDLKHLSELDAKNRTALLNMKEGQKKRIRFTEEEFAVLYRNRNEFNCFDVKYRLVLQALKDACDALGIPYRKGQGTHGLRYDAVAKYGTIYQEQGIDKKDASDILTRLLAHYRKSADAPYRPSAKKILTYKERND